jgi:hypothetical protein
LTEGFYPFSTDGFKKADTSTPEPKLYIAFEDYGTARCKALHLFLRPTVPVVNAFPTEQSKEALEGCGYPTAANIAHAADQIILLRQLWKSPLVNWVPQSV